MLSLAKRLNEIVDEMKARSNALLSAKSTNPEVPSAPKSKQP
ncbi:hypothetical protein RCIP0035_00031 [Klebsiella phage RCIP0035]